MQAKLKKTIQELVDNRCKNKADLSTIVTEILDRYTENTGDGLVALFYPIGSFNAFGQFKYAQGNNINPKISSSIVTACNRRAKMALEYRIKEEQEAMKQGFITCA